MGHDTAPPCSQAPLQYLAGRNLSIVLPNTLSALCFRRVRMAGYPDRCAGRTRSTAPRRCPATPTPGRTRSPGKIYAKTIMISTQIFQSSSLDFEQVFFSTKVYNGRKMNIMVGFLFRVAGSVGKKIMCHEYCSCS